MKKSRNIFAMLLISILLITALVACGGNEEVVNVDPVVEVTDPDPVEDTTPEEVVEPVAVPLIVTYTEFSQKFSPFFSDSGYDADVAAMTQISLMTTDRVGGVIFNAIEGETVAYNGVDYLYTGPADLKVEYDEASDTTKYSAKIREDLVFSDGVPVTIDDVIFTYYTILDPAFTGASSLGSYDIVGLQDYQTKTTSEVFDKYSAIVDGILAAGDDHVWVETDSWTEAQQDDFWAKLKALWITDIEAVVTACNGQYFSYYEEEGFAADVVSADDNFEIMIGMAVWNFGHVNADGLFEGVVTGTTWDLVDTFPTIEDYYLEAYAAYGGMPDAWIDAGESMVGDALTPQAVTKFVGEWGPADEALADFEAPNISGIVKTGDYSVEVTVKGFEAPAVYSILGAQITPLHYYGDAAMYDYENNMFGFEFGDMSLQESVTATPLGAGAYKYVEYNNKVVYFAANELFYRGAPKIQEIQFKETESADVPSALQTGTADAGELSYNKARFAEIQSYNSDGEISGDVITMSKVDNLGYGYIGISADHVNVAGEPGSDASKNLRKAIATALAVYRDVGIDSYYGEGASVINYPISNTSWAAPQSTDDDYRLAFSVDVDGNPIYTADMSPDEKYAAAQAASLGFFEAAGYTVVDGAITAAPEGAEMSYELLVGGDGTGDHPAFAIVTDASALLAEIGFDLDIVDLVDWTVILDTMDADTLELWAAAWGASIDPDMYQLYHTDSAFGAGGSDDNHGAIRDAELDELILAARISADQNYRKGVYKEALEIVMDWATEIPNYQRKNAIIFSTVRINLETLTPDITTYWGWLNDIELLEMNPAE